MANLADLKNLYFFNSAGFFLWGNEFLQNQGQRIFVYRRYKAINYFQNAPMYRNILFIDDDRDDREMLEEAIDSIASGKAYRAASNGSQAMEILQKGRELPDLIFLDLIMPGVMGTELLHKIKACDGINQIPVALYSSHTLEVMQHLAGHLKPAYYIQKPNSYPELVAALRHIF